MLQISLSLLQRLLPELQARFNAANQTGTPVSIRFAVNDQEAGLRLLADGTLQTFSSDEEAIRLALPGHLFWRALLGESSWSQLEPTLDQQKNCGAARQYPPYYRSYFHNRKSFSGDQIIIEPWGNIHGCSLLHTGEKYENRCDTNYSWNNVAGRHP